MLKDGGVLLCSVMSLWGTCHRYLGDVLQIPPAQNKVITDTGDLSPATLPENKHYCRMYRAAGFREMLERNHLPVVALSEMGTTDILAPGSGAFSPPNDPKAFGEALGNVLKHPQAWQHLNDEAPIYAREWSDVAMAERLASLYRELSARKAGQKAPLTAAA